MVNDYIFDILIQHNDSEVSQDMIELFESVYEQNLKMLNEIESEDSQRFARIMGHKLRENLDRYYESISEDQDE